MSKSVINHQQEQATSIREAEGKIVFQMVLSKLLHIRKLLEGVEYKNDEEETVVSNYTDPTIISPLVRNAYETICMFHIVFVKPDSEDKKTILYNLWVIAGLKYRQRFVSVITTEENAQKAAEEQQIIAEYITEIENTQLYAQLDDRNKNKIQTAIKKKEFKIKINDGHVKFLNWKEISLEFIIKTNAFEHMYTYFSLYAHPSNVSVFQFGQMFQASQEANQIILFNIRFCLALTSVFIADYIKNYSSVLSTFESYSPIQQVLLNHYNRFLRGAEFSINNADDIL
jgi:hypothetical protein